MGFADYKIDKTVPVPRYYQLKQIILSEIRKGAVGPEDAIPTEEEFCSLYDISRTTVRQAITELVSEGKLYRVKSKGTFVSMTSSRMQIDLSRMYTSFIADVRELSMKPSMKVLSVEVVPATAEVAAGLMTEKDTPVICVKRYQMADDVISSSIESYLLYPDCSQALEAHKFEHLSMYQILGERSDTATSRVLRRITSCLATPEDVALLHVPEGSAIALVVNQGFSAARETPVIIEWVRYIGEKNVLILDQRIDPESFSF